MDQSVFKFKPKFSVKAIVRFVVLCLMIATSVDPLHASETVEAYDSAGTDSEGVSEIPDAELANGDADGVMDDSEKLANRFKAEDKDLGKFKLSTSAQLLESADEKAEAVASAQAGEELTVVYESNDFVRVRFSDGRYGYIKRNLLANAPVKPKLEANCETCVQEPKVATAPQERSLIDVATIAKEINSQPKKFRIILPSARRSQGTRSETQGNRRANVPVPIPRPAQLAAPQRRAEPAAPQRRDQAQRPRAQQGRGETVGARGQRRSQEPVRTEAQPQARISGSYVDRLIAATKKEALECRRPASHLKRRRGGREICGNRSKGMCYRAVKEALVRAGVTKSNLPGVSAVMAHTKGYLKAAGLRNILASSNRRLSTSQSTTAAQRAPVGAILVYSGGSHRHGHIEIKTGKELYCSDYCTSHPVSRTNDRYLVGIYVP